ENTIQVSHTDVEGNVDESSLTVTINTVAADVVADVSLAEGEDSNTDGKINKEELGTDQSVKVDIVLGTDAKVGDVITVDGQDYSLTQAELDA
ncbi:hypothetical protein NL318_27645, partial [Klebsiella pneumoniae]|nr:hypothetical protein [Klebsiella pneumoniae]